MAFMNYILFILFKTMLVLIFQGKDFEYSNYTIMEFLDNLQNPVSSFFSIQDNDHRGRLIL